MSNTVDMWHLINGEYVHIIQITDGTQRTYYTDGKREGIVDITGPSYAKREYSTHIINLKCADGTVLEREVSIH